MAYYKKTPKYEESKIPFTLHNMKSQDYLQRIKEALKSSILQKLESDTLIIGVDFKRKSLNKKEVKKWMLFVKMKLKS